MAPRPGGEADKLGNRYEAAWAIRHALHCIAEGTHSITLEDPDSEVNAGSEFTYQSATSTEVHQLKRQNRNRNSWSVKELASHKVFEVAAAHVRAGREYHFVSQIPCRKLDELTERARQSPDWATFNRTPLTSDLGAEFDQVSASFVHGTPEQAWQTLRGMKFSVHNERDIIRTNAMVAGILLEGASGELIPLTIGHILLQNLGRKLTQSDLLDFLGQRGIHLINIASRKNARERVRQVTKSWRYSVRRELLDPRIERCEAAQLIDSLRDCQTAFLAGTAGSGKSSVLEQAVQLIEASDAIALAFRLDRLDSFASTLDLGRQLGLETSPANALALAAEGRDAYLVIDQLDAVSLASGRTPENFDVIADLIEEALSAPGLRVILACREFDVENDHRIRSLVHKKGTALTPIGLLPDEMVDTAVVAMGFAPAQLTASQRSILQTPLHLVLLKTIAHQPGALDFQSRGSLFEAFWERKRQTSRLRRNSVRFDKVISRIAVEASKRQTLSIPVELLDDGDLIEDANVLVSEHVLARDGSQIAFFHEAFFDYAFARQWTSRSESLVSFLLRDEQELFRRAQVRQILQHLSEREPDLFLTEMEAVLTSNQVRFHIKETAFSVISSLSAPASDDAEVIVRVASIAPEIARQLWLCTRRAPWFRRFHEDGLIDEWLDSGNPTLQARALNLMSAGMSEYASKVAEILRSRIATPQYLAWVRSTVQGSNALHSREMFELLLGAVRDGGFDTGEHELWQTVHSLAEHHPLWAIELIQARIIDHPEGLQVDGSGKVALLKTHDYSASTLVHEASGLEPLAFTQAVVPYLIQVMAATAHEPSLDGVIRDQHFSGRYAPDELDASDRHLDGALFAGAIDGLEALARSEPAKIRPLLEDLASSPHESAQFLLYRTLTAGVTNYTEWAANLLLEGGARLRCGYLSDPRWTARELLEAIAPNIKDEVHRQLEDQFRDLHYPFETGPRSGWSSFIFLSALEQHRLSPAGIRRLEEYRRKFHATEPSKPRAIVAGIIGSPIPSEATHKMSDNQWLGAISRYASEERHWDTFTGGALELSRALRARVVTDPTRFARFALQLKSDSSSVYSDALLMGFAEANHTDEAALPIFDAVRHIATLGHNGTDRWLGPALRHYYREVPLDLVELILDRALHSNDPVSDTPILIRDNSDSLSAVDMRTNAINTARGSLVESLGDLLVYDVDGERTELVQPHLGKLASDPVIFVRSSVAHVLAAALRHARPAAVTAFQLLIDAEDRILATDLVQQLMLYIGNVEPTVIYPVINRMLDSPDAEARQAGGSIAAFAALEWDGPELMARALAGDIWVRKGVAEVCVNRVDHTSNVALVNSTLTALMYDNEPEVRKAAAQVGAHLRNHPLRPFTDLLSALIESPAYEYSTPQLLITLQNAPDKVDGLALQAAQRFVSIFGSASSDLRTGAAGDAHYISEIIVRGLAQSRDKKHRAALLDVLDGMFARGAYGVDAAIAASERR